MNLKSLLKLTEFFYKKANLRFYSFAQDAGTINKLTNVAELLKAEDKNDLAYQVIILIKLYKKAFEIDGGYYYVKQFAENLFEEYMENEDSMDEESEEVSDMEMVIELVSKEMRDAIKTKYGNYSKTGKDDQESVKLMRDYKIDVETRRDEGEEGFGEQGINEIANPEAISTYDNRGQFNVENKGESVIGRGLHSSLTERARYYEAKVSNLQERLKDPEEAANKKVLQEYIDLIKQMIPVLLKRQELEDQLAIVEDPYVKMELGTLEDKYKEMQNKSNSLSGRIRRGTLANQIREIDKTLKNLTGKDKILAEQKKALYELGLSRDLFRSRERMLRTQLIEMYESGNYPNPTLLTNMLKQIEEAKALRKRNINDVSKEAARLKGTLLSFLSRTKQLVSEFKTNSLGTTAFAHKAFFDLFLTDPLVSEQIKSIEKTKEQYRLLESKKAIMRKNDFAPFAAKYKELGEKLVSYKVLFRELAKANIEKHPDSDLKNLMKTLELVMKYLNNLTKVAKNGAFGEIIIVKDGVVDESDSVMVDSRDVYYKKYDTWIKESEIITKMLSSTNFHKISAGAETIQSIIDQLFTIKELIKEYKKKFEEYGDME